MVASDEAPEKEEDERRKVAKRETTRSQQAGAKGLLEKDV